MAKHKPKPKRVIQTRGRRIYKNPPIHEAVCEFQFSDPESWSLVHGGIFFERLKKRYSGKPSEQRILRVMMPKGAPLTAGPPAIGEITKVQLKSENEREMVAVGPGILSIHSLKPYSGWEHFRSQIVEALREYRRIASPKAIRRIGIRYINQIFIPSEKGVPGDLLTTPPYGIPNMECRIAAFAMRYQYALENSASAIVQMASLDGPPDTYGVALDIDVNRSWQGESYAAADAMKAVDELRAQERHVFEALISDKARDLFDA